MKKEQELMWVRIAVGLLMSILAGSMISGMGAKAFMALIIGMIGVGVMFI